MMPKYLLFIALFIISCSQDPCKMIYGKWEIYKYTPVNQIVGCISKEECDIMIPYFIGKEVEICRKYVVLDKEHFENPIYEITEENIDELLWGYRIGNAQTDFGIEENVSTVKVLNIDVRQKDLDNMKTLKFVSPFQYDVGRAFSFGDIILCEDKEELLLFFDSACFHLRKVK